MTLLKDTNTELKIYRILVPVLIAVTLLLAVTTTCSLYQYTQITNTNKAISAKLNKVNDELTEAKEQISELNIDIAEYKNTVDDYKQEIARYKSDINELENQVTWAETTTTRSTSNNTVAYADDNISSYNSSNDNSSYSGSYTRVYVTDTGKKYHEYGCKYLKDSCNSISLKDAQNQGYTPCSVCKP